MMARILDLFAGLGGWSKPYVDDGDEVIGIDNPLVIDTRVPKDNQRALEMIIERYPGQLIIQDVRSLDPHLYRGFDLIIGSPPCREYSEQTHANKNMTGRSAPDPNKGLSLVKVFMKFVKIAQPKFWAMENVRLLERHLRRFTLPPIWHFYVSVRGERSLWGNIPIPPLSPDFHFSRNLEWDYTKFNFPERSALRAQIPYPIARFVADCVKNGLKQTEEIQVKAA